MEILTDGDIEGSSKIQRRQTRSSLLFLLRAQTLLFRMAADTDALHRNFHNKIFYFV
jgi:hypothetical protein